MTLLLASASPRRQALLREAGYEFALHPADLDEDSFLNKMLPRECARFLAVAKADQVAALHPGDVTLAADTIVAFGDLVLGKPGSAEEARKMIRLLAGTTQVVVTAVAVACPERDLKAAATAMSAVRMKPLTAGEVEAYVASGRWEGKAGGYGIQDEDPIVTCTRGRVDTVIGLPMKETRQLLDRAGVHPVPRAPDP